MKTIFYVKRRKINVEKMFVLSNVFSLESTKWLVIIYKTYTNTEIQLLGIYYYVLKYLITLICTVLNIYKYRFYLFIYLKHNGKRSEV